MRDCAIARMRACGHVRTPSARVDCRPAMWQSVSRQGIYVEYPVEYSKCCALNGIPVSTVDDCRLLN
eukprot:4923619-Pyramimonas_sp.AAC.2